jgi:diamine N-acetyltransferase
MPDATSFVRLRPTTVADLDYVMDAEHDDENRVFVVPWTREQHGHALTDPDLMHRIIESAAGVTVGFLLLAGLASPHGSVEFRRIVITRKGQGHGRAALRALRDLAFLELGAHRLWLDVKEHNARARHIYGSEGFVEEGVLRECIKGPEGFESMVIMSILETEYRSRFAPS